MSLGLRPPCPVDTCFAFEWSSLIVDIIAANGQYMTTSNSYLLPYSGLVRIRDGSFKGHKWAEPSGEALQTLLRQVLRCSFRKRVTIHVPC